MTLAVQQSLFKASGGTPLVEAARWIEGSMMGNIALGLCVVAVAFIGAMMLTGQMQLREGMRVVIGCFVLLGAPVIATGSMRVGSGKDYPSPPVPPIAVPSEIPRGNLPPEATIRMPARRWEGIK
jgi:type IV secretory pathway VirB2 component (pilin)